MHRWHHGPTGIPPVSVAHPCAGPPEDSSRVLLRIRMQRCADQSSTRPEPRPWGGPSSSDRTGFDRRGSSSAQSRSGQRALSHWHEPTFQQMSTILLRSSIRGFVPENWCSLAMRRGLVRTIFHRIDIESGLIRAILRWTCSIPHLGTAPSLPRMRTANPVVSIRHLCLIQTFETTGGKQLRESGEYTQADAWYHAGRRLGLPPDNQPGTAA